MTITRKPKVKAHTYERFGSILAIAPKAFFESYFFFDDHVRENTVMGDAVVVDVRDPLEQRAHYCYDSYEEILARVRSACESSCRAVILRFDSPGGEAAGCFESALEARAICDAAGKQLHAYIEGDCCSAAYAFAVVCQTITVGQTALAGSIGVLMGRHDYSAQNAQRGIRVAFITSGARKADGHPDNPITDAELAALQPVIDSMGAAFHQHVAAARGMSIEAVAQLEAKIFDGAAAVAAGLADAVGNLQSVLELIASGGVATKGSNTMAMTYEKARAALEELASGEDANAKAAQAALAAMDGAGDGPGDGDEPAEPKDDDAEPGTTAEPPPAGDPKKDDDTKAAAAAYREALAARAETAKLRAELRLEREQVERDRLIASRAFDEATVKLLQKAPIELVREHVKALPAAPVNPQLEGVPTRGRGQEVAGLDPAAKAALDARMGITPATRENVNTPTRLTLSARRGSSAAAELPADLPTDKPN